MRTINYRIFYILIVILSALTSCGVNSNLMLKTPKGVPFKYDSIPMKPKDEYRISIDDKISFTISNNLGHKIIENQTGIGGVNTTAIGTREIDYTVNNEGIVNLPIVGEVKVHNLTIGQCEDTLAKLYAKEHQQPFVQVKVTNQRVIVFPGGGSDAKVIPLLNSNTTLMEALAQAGGISDRGRANSIKLMRKNGGKREVYLIDLSTIDGLKYTDMIIQSNDYIYIEPDPQIGKETLERVAPFVSILSSITIIIIQLTK